MLQKCISNLNRHKICIIKHINILTNIMHKIITLSKINKSLKNVNKECTENFPYLETSGAETN